MQNKQDIFLIGGGMTFKNHKDYIHFLKNRTISIEKKNSWTGEYLDKKLGKDFNIIRPRMPLQDNAKYEEWKIYFERFIPLLKPGVIFIGNSLGGIFLAKYLSEHTFPKKIGAILLVCPPFDNTVTGEDLVGGFNLKSNISLLQKQSKNVHLFFSEDDEVVPVSHAEKYRGKLPHVNIHIYKNKNGHFQIAEFPEIVKIIKSI